MSGARGANRGGGPAPQGFSRQPVRKIATIAASVIALGFWAYLFASGKVTL